MLWRSYLKETPLKLCFPSKLSSPFFQPPVLFLFMQTSHVPYSCSDHHFLLSLFNHPPPQLLLCSTALIAAMASRWSYPCHASHACNFMEVVPHFQKNIFSSSPGWYKIPFSAIDKSHNNKHWSWFAKRRGLQICPSMVEFTSVRNMNNGVKRKCE